MAANLTEEVVRGMRQTVTELTAQIEAEKTKRHRAQAELQTTLTEIDGTAKALDTWAGTLDEMAKALFRRRDDLDARQDAARDALAELGAGEMGGATP